MNRFRCIFPLFEKSKKVSNSSFNVSRSSASAEGSRSVELGKGDYSHRHLGQPPRRLVVLGAPADDGEGSAFHFPAVETALAAGGPLVVALFSALGLSSSSLLLRELAEVACG